jgi:hypothetical protein
MACHDYGVGVGIFNPQPRSRASWQLQAVPPVFFRDLKEKAVAACQFAPKLQDSEGEIKRPVGW